MRPLLSENLAGVLRKALGRDTSDLVPPWISRSFAEETGLDEVLKKRSSPHAEGRTGTENLVSSVTDLGDVAATIHWLDRNLAPQGVEVRHPFLDRALAEFMVAVPVEQTYRAGLGKIMLRDAMRGSLPESIRCRGDKAVFTGFSERQLSRQGGDLAALLEGGRLVEAGVLDPAGLRAALTAWREGREGREGLGVGVLLRTLGCELWCRAV
jgi:asparagine synthase (glutamine-hydrolysing)